MINYKFIKANNLEDLQIEVSRLVGFGYKLVTMIVSDSFIDGREFYATLSFGKG